MHENQEVCSRIQLFFKKPLQLQWICFIFILQKQNKTQYHLESQVYKK